MKAGPRADPMTLVRRAYLDLTGLPPTPEQVDEFPRGHRAGRLGAPDRAAARLAALRRALGPALDGRGPLRRLDGVRAGLPAATTRGGTATTSSTPSTTTSPTTSSCASRSRATSSTTSPTRTLIATGFLRAGPRVNFREKDNPERRHDYLDDVLGTLGRGRPRHDRALRPLPRPQVRPDPAEGLLQHAGVDLRLRRDRLPAPRPGRRARVPREERGPRRGPAAVARRDRRDRGPAPRAPAHRAHQGAFPRERAAGGVQARGGADGGRAAAGRPGAVDQPAAAAGRRGPVGGGGRPLEQADGGGGGPRRGAPAGAADGGDCHRRRLPVRPGRPGRQRHRVSRVPHPARRAGVVPPRGGRAGLRGAAQLLPDSRATRSARAPRCRPGS